MGVSCSVHGENYPIVTLTPASVTQTPVVTQTPTDTPTQTSTPYFIPLGPTSLPSPTAMPPYPTASVVNANAVAFISYDKTDYFLWVANVDGSGERKLTNIEENATWVSRYLLQWSPDGKWISYISGDDLWIISPDGSVKRKILSIQNTNKKIIRQYAWSPDGTKIAYLLAANWGDFPEVKMGLLDLAIEKNSEFSVYQSPANIVLSWSPDGRYILLNTEDSLKVFEVSAGKVAKEINSACPIWHGGPVWSPNSKWFYRADYGTGSYYIWVCMNGLNGASWQAVDGVISQPVWDETGNFLYFVARKDNPANTLNLNIDEQLMRYDVSTQKTKHLLSLIIKQTPYSFMHSISISPDRHTLLLRSQYSETKFDLVFMDIQSLATTKFTVDFEKLKIPLLNSSFLETDWSPDNQNIILFAGDYQNGFFYIMNVKTGKINIFSGRHSTEHWAISPVATTP